MQNKNKKFDKTTCKIIRKFYKENIQNKKKKFYKENIQNKNKKMIRKTGINLNF